MTDLHRLLWEENEAWGALGRCFDRVGDERFEEPTLTAEGWSPKDAMFHISGWMADCAVQLGRIREGSFDPAEETREAIERQNRAWFEISSATGAPEVRAGFEASRRRMLEAIGTLDEITPEAVEWFEESGALHYAKHAEDLRSFLEASAP